MISKDQWRAMDLVAAAGTVEAGASLIYIDQNIHIETVSSEDGQEFPLGPSFDEDDAGAMALDAKTNLENNAPISIKEDFDLVCQHHLYRKQLIKAMEDDSGKLVVEIQSCILGLIDR